MTFRRLVRPTTLTHALCVALLLTCSSCISSRSLVEGTAAGESAAAASPPARHAAADTSNDPRHVWTLNECVQYAWTHNRAIARARWRMLGALAALDQADGELLPSLRADGSAGTRSNDSGIDFEGTRFVTGDRSVATGDILASMPLFGLPLGRRAAARHGLAGSHADIRQIRADVSFAIAHAITDVLEAHARMELIAASAQTLSEQARIAEERQHAGLVFATDAMADRVRLAEREQDRLQAANDAAIAQGRLNRLLALPMERQLILAEVAAPAARQTDEKALIRLALTHRQDLVAARERLVQTQEEVRNAQSGYLPQVNVVGGLYRTTDSLVLNRQWFGASLDVTIPLLDNGVVAAQVDAQRARAGEQSEALNDMIDAIGEDVHEAVLALQESTARAPVAQQADGLAQQRLQQVQDQYRQGLTDMTTVLAAENEAVTTKLQYLRARLDCRRASDQLDNATFSGLPGDAQ